MSGRPDKKQEELLQAAQEQARKQLEGAGGLKAATEAARLAAQAAIKANIKGTPKPPVLPENVRQALAQIIAREREATEQAESQVLQAAIKWVEDKWGSQVCPYCQHAEWQVGTPLEITALNGEVMSPAFPVMCGNCGHTTFVNAIRAGLLSESDEGGG
jgi:hypothetical protein